jgi:hypothetical protein
MLKKFFRKVRKVAKDIAPIAAPIAGFAFGAPVGAGIGALLGQYGGKEGALRAAALGGIGGLVGGFSGGARGMDLLGTRNLGGFGEGINKLLLDQTRQGNFDQKIIDKQGLLSKIGNFATSGKGLLTAGAIAAFLNRKEEDDPEMRPEPEVGSQGQLGGLGDTTITYLDPLDPIYPKNQIGYGGAVPQFNMGGIAQLEKGGTVDDYGGIEAFNRKNGEIAGPGTMTSDDIPAMLSDGEFVTKAISVLGAGVKHGKAKTKEEARKKGAEFFYNQQRELEPFGKKVV